MNLLKSLFRPRTANETQCLQCGLIPGKEYMVATSDPIMHPHKCSWCKSVVYFPGPVFECSICNPDAKPRVEPAA